MADTVSDYSAPSALNMIEECQRAFRQLREFPETGHPHQHLPARYRVLAVGRWLIVHSLTGTTVEVVRIIHGSQDLRRIEF